MSTPSSQMVASWLLSDMRNRDWMSVPDALMLILTNRLPGVAETQLSDLVDIQITHVVAHVLQKYDTCYQDGAVFTHQIDDNDPPYIKFIGEDIDVILTKLKKIDPFSFEDVCSKLLETLGCSSTPATISVHYPLPTLHPFPNRAKARGSIESPAFALV